MSAALVLLMTPGLAPFSGGMVRAENVVSAMMLSFVSLGVVTVLRALAAFSPTSGHGGGGRAG